jgi:hypothetical protein
MFTSFKDAAELLLAEHPAVTGVEDRETKASTALKTNSARSPSRRRGQRYFRYRCRVRKAARRLTFLGRYTYAVNHAPDQKAHRY